MATETKKTGTEKPLSPIQVIDQQVEAFKKAAVTRDGRKKEINFLQRDARGMITTLVGKIEDAKGSGKMIDMYWNINGGAMLGSTFEFDLVTQEKA